MTLLHTSKESLDYIWNQHDSLDEDHRKLIDNNVIRLCEDVFRPTGAPYWFTNHGKKHSDAVLYAAATFASSLTRSFKSLNELEIMTLICSCYLHDFAMAHLPEGATLKKGYSSEIIDEVRKSHVDNITKVMRLYANDLQSLYDRLPQLETTIPLVCKAHGTASHTKALREIEKAGIANFRGQLLGKILLISDEIDLEYHRSLIHIHQHFNSFPDESKIHNFKHHYITDVTLMPPSLEVTFCFPTDMPDDNRNMFIEWVFGKIRNQIKLITEHMPNEYHTLFNLHMVPQIIEASNREKFPETLARRLKHSLSLLSDKAHAKSDNIIGLARVNQYDPRRDWRRRPEPMAPYFGKLVDDFFRDCDSLSTSDIFGDLYIPVDANIDVGNLLAERFVKFALFNNVKTDCQAQSEQVFCVTAPAGAGKSALLKYLKATGKLKTILHKDVGKMIVVHIDCLNILYITELFQKMIEGVVNESNKIQGLKAVLKKDSYADSLSSRKLSAMTGDVVLRNLNTLLNFVNKANGSSKGSLASICFLFDNLDCATGGHDLRKEIYRTAHDMAKKGLAFFVVPLRNGTKHRLDAEMDDIHDIPENNIEPPDVAEVIKKRLVMGFAINSDDDKSKRNKTRQSLHDDMDTILRNKMRINSSSLMNILIDVINELSKQQPNTHGHLPLIPALAGTNVRDALTLYRSIIKSLREEDILSITGNTQTTALMERNLIKTLAYERHACYYAKQSKLRNLFDRDVTQYRFLKFYIMEILLKIQRGRLGDNFVYFKEWSLNAERYNIHPNDFCKEAWSLLCGEFPLVSLEDHETTLPNKHHPHVESLIDSSKVMLSSAGKYYIEWLAYSASYIECILQDTLVSQGLAKKLGENSKDGKRASVNEFLQYLQKEEERERAILNMDSLPQPICPRLINKIYRQYGG